MSYLFAVALPILFWQGGVQTAPQLRQAGITQIAVPAAETASWKTFAGISVDPVDLAATVKLPNPGVDFRTDEASASRVPWVSSNGWRFMRQPNARFYYDAPASSASLAAAEAFCYASRALIRTDATALTSLSKMLAFLARINSNRTKPLADIDFIDDGSAASAEVMNLMVRDNLLFDIVRSSQPTFKLLVRLGSKQYPEKDAKDADTIVHKIRANLTDSKRSLRIFGTSVVIARLTAEPNNLRLHLLNYGAAAHTRVGAFRVRVLGRYSKSTIHSFESPDEQLVDYEPQSDATEFTVPELKTYAVVDLTH
jgi:hypothetical protein